MTKKQNKIVSTILLAVIVMINILPTGISLAVNVGDTVGLTSLGNVPYHLKSHSLPSGGYVITSLAGYHENGKFYPAYCINKDKPGVDDNREYDVTLTEILSDQVTYNKVWRVVTAGYPYNSPESLGVSDWRYAYQATKMAVYCVLGQSNVNSFYATDSTGQAIVNLINRLVNEGENGTATYRTPVANINKSGNMILSGDYYVQNYSVTTNVSQEVETLENYKLNKETQTIKLEENQIKDITFKNEKKKGQIKVIKVDFDNKEVKLPNIEFKVYDEKGNVVDTLVTDKNGKATSKRLPIDQEYKVQETKTLETYVLNEETKTVILKQDQITSIEFENEKIKGKIEITKISAYDNKLTGETKGTKLDGAIFEIYNDKDKLVDTITIKKGIGTVMLGFETVEKPFIFAKVLPTVQPEDRWINYTNLTGNYKEHELEDKAEWTTISYGKKLEIKKLPRTGY